MNGWDDNEFPEFECGEHGSPAEFSEIVMIPMPNPFDQPMEMKFLEHPGYPGRIPVGSKTVDGAIADTGNAVFAAGE